jgi:hypothetical protein
LSAGLSKAGRNELCAEPRSTETALLHRRFVDALAAGLSQGFTPDEIANGTPVRESVRRQRLMALSGTAQIGDPDAWMQLLEPQPKHRAPVYREPEYTSTAARAEAVEREVDRASSPATGPAMSDRHLRGVQ